MTDRQVVTHRKTAKYKSKRRISRELVLQGLYQWRLTGGTESAIALQLRETQVFCRADEAFFSRLLSGVLAHVIQLEQTIQPYLDRPIKELSPVEYGILLLSTYEFIYFLDVPYRAIINEAIELARIYGGSDGYKYVNGVLDKLAYKLRTIETA